MPTRPTVVVATHGHCFDGLASAVLFSRLYARLHPTQDASFIYKACDYGPGDSAVPASWLIGQDNAILDFRYTAIPSLTWYFDHHATAFRTPEDRAIFDGGLPEKRFYEPTYSSCTQLIADVARDTFDVALDELGALVRWADIIDAARFPSAEIAVARSAPELQLMTVIEHHGDDAFLTALVPRLLTRTPGEVALDKDIQALARPLDEKRARVIERMRQRAVPRSSVVFCDLSDEPTEVAEKFALYALFPTSRYSVVLSRSAGRAKISIGYNPWGGTPRAHNLGEICKRYGGGGHPVVGAITLSAAEATKAHDLCKMLVAELESLSPTMLPSDSPWRRREGASPQIIGHRGVRGPLPENTMAAFERAAEEGADAIELDVRLCAKGEVVVMHDPELTRVTNGADTRQVHTLSYAELARVDLGEGQHPPRLSEVLDWARGRRLRVNVELKRDVPNRTAVVRETAKLVKLLPDANRYVLVSCFDPLMLAGFRAFGTGVPSAFLFERGHAHLKPWLWARGLGADAAHPERVLTKPHEVARARSLGMVINVWTINDESEAIELAALGVDGLITDRPAAIRAAFETR